MNKKKKIYFDIYFYLKVKIINLNYSIELKLLRSFLLKNIIYKNKLFHSETEQYILDK